MKSTALTVALLAGTGFGVTTAQAHDGRTPMLGSTYPDTVQRQQCMRGYIWDAQLMRCVRKPPRGSF